MISASQITKIVELIAVVGDWNILRLNFILILFF